MSDTHDEQFPLAAYSESAVDVIAADASIRYRQFRQRFIPSVDSSPAPYSLASAPPQDCLPMTPILSGLRLGWL